MLPPAWVLRPCSTLAWSFLPGFGCHAYYILFDAGDGIAPLLIFQLVLFFMASVMAKSLLFPFDMSTGSSPLHGSREMRWIRSAVMGMCSSSHKHPSCTRKISSLMMKMVIGAWWKCSTQSGFNSLAFSTPHNHFCGSNSISPTMVFCLGFMRFLVSRWVNFSWLARSQSSNFRLDTRPRCVPSKIMLSGRSKV